jgi:signal transduction histidine kinase
MVGQYMRYAALILAMWGIIDHVRMHYRGKLKDWRSKWHRTCFELLLLLVVSIGTLSTVFGQQDELYDLSPMTMLILSYDTILFLVMMSIIITNEFRHEHAQAQVQLEVKRMFVKYVSHEVRTPLNSCMLGIQYMKEAILHPTKECVQEIAGILDEVSEGCSTAIDFMNNLLLYEKIDSMDLPLYLKREDLSKVCTEVLQSFKMSARQLEINLKLHIHNTLEVPGILQNINNDKFSELLTANVEIDGPKILIVLRNLMSNALKFTPENGEVSLSVTPICLPTYENHIGKRQDPRQVGNIIPKCPLKDTTHFRVILSDSGRGMALDEQLQLFTKIVQFSPNENQKGGGSGIGLFLSHHIMKDHKLDIQVFSEGVVGCGTHFFIDFPRMLTADEKLSHIETSGNFDEDKKCMSSSDSDSTAKSPQSLISHSLQSIISRNHHAKITTESLGTLNHPSTHGDANTPPIEDENENEGAVDHLIADSGESSKSARGHDKSEMVDPFRQKHSSTILSKIVVPRSQSFGPTTNKRLEDLSVLVVDDSALNRKMLIRILKQHHIGSSYEGLSDGMMLVKELSVKSDLINNSKNFAKKGDESVRKYDVILLDDHMIDMDGSEAIRILRRAGYDGLVVGLTGSAMDKDLNAFCAAGVDYALPKPFVVDDFIHILRCSFSM